MKAKRPSCWYNLSKIHKEVIFMLDIQGKTILVTGAARGIGRLMSIRLSEFKVNLILVSRDKSHTSDVEEIARKNGSTAVSFGCDLGSKDDVEKLIKELSEYDIYIVFNNAGIQVTYRPDVYDTTWEDYEKSFRVNTIAPMMICYSILPSMLEKGFGRIVNTTSGIMGEPEQGPYSASKAGLDKTTADLLKLTKGKDVLVYLTDPGWCRTDLGGPMAPNEPSSAVVGCLAPAFTSKGPSGSVVHAQDYASMSFQEAVAKLESLS